MSGAVRALARVSRRLGRDLLLVQAGGGNVSLKSGGGLLIKASGARLRLVGPRRGWTRADGAALDRGLAAAARRPWPRREIAYADLIGRASPARGPRASMEAGFHAAIPQRWVAHVHSVGGLLLGLEPRREALSWVREALGPEVAVEWVPACLPGLELSLRVKAAAAAGPGPRLWLVRNHGLIWSADDERALLAASDRLEKGLRRRYGLARFPPPHPAGGRGCRRRPRPRVGWREYCLCGWPRARLTLRPLFPDFLIYFRSLDGRTTGLELAPPRGFRVGDDGAARDRVEVFYAHALAATLGPRRGAALPARLERSIRGLETEKRRLAQAGAA